MRCVLLCIAVVAGCGPAVNSDPTITADLACETARMAVLHRIKPPQPSPAPDAGACDNCNGTGKIGDGKIVMTCPTCRGTGKKDRSVLCKSGACHDAR